MLNEKHVLLLLLLWLMMMMMIKLKYANQKKEPESFDGRREKMAFGEMKQDFQLTINNYLTVSALNF